MLRRIAGFRQDEAGEWAAELSCLHGQHIRHRPPFQNRPWVLTEAGRDEHLGTDIDCPLCDRAEIPAGLQVTRTAGPFDQDTIPPALREDHVVGEGRWGCLRVLEGNVGFVMATDPPMELRLEAGDAQAIPPGVAHHLVVEAPAVVAVDFLVRPGSD